MTSFMMGFIENFPESKKIMQGNPSYQNRFILEKSVLHEIK